MAARGVISDSQDVQANECAQALLELAMSFKPPCPPSSSNFAESINRSSEPSYVTPVPAKRPTRNRQSLSPKWKRTSPTISPPRNFKPYCVLKRKGVSRGQIYNELVSSIQLDHSYSVSGRADHDDQHTTSVSAADENVQHNVVVSRPSVSLLTNPRTDKLNTGHQQRDLFKSDDANFENLGLLLKCLTNVEEPYTEQKKHTNGKGKSPGNNKKDGNANDLSAGSEEAARGDSPLFQCKDCAKSFSKKRYLIKHAQRMHNSSIQTAENILCRHCEQYFPQAEFATHTCPRQELANCQFCGLRLRSHVLAKHLEQEHGVERSASDDDCGGSSTISGSEHDQLTASPTTSSTVTCGVCQNAVRPAALQQHVYEHIASLPSPVTGCPLCPLSFSEPELLLQHVVDTHCNRPSPLGAGLPPRGGDERGSCKHSMLQRFLRDSRSGGQAGGLTDGGEQCAECVGSLVTSMASSSSSSHPPLQCAASSLLERTTTELIEAALQCAGK